VISQRAKYAMRALVMLAKAPIGQSLSITEISVEQKIPKKFLEQILLELKRHGLVESRRGKDGGYLMRRAPGDVTYGEVLRLVDGPLALLPCLSKIAYKKCEDCSDEASCEVRRVFAEVAVATRAVLDAATLQSSIENSNPDFGVHLE
jgi:Rrf2 family protein